MATVQKRLAIVLAIDGHAEELGVKLLGACHVLHMQDEMVDAVGLDHVAFLLSAGVHSRLHGWQVGHATHQRHCTSWLHGRPPAHGQRRRGTVISFKALPRSASPWATWRRSAAVSPASTLAIRDDAASRACCRCSAPMVVSLKTTLRRSSGCVVRLTSSRRTRRSTVADAVERATPRCSATLERGAPGLPLRNVSTRN